MKKSKNICCFHQINKCDFSLFSSQSATDAWTVEVITDEEEWSYDFNSSVEESEGEDRRDTPVKKPSHCCKLFSSTKGILAALLAGGVLSGFIPILIRLPEDSENISMLQILLLCSLLHLLVSIFLLCHRKNRTWMCLGPTQTWPRGLIFSLIQLICMGCAYTSFTHMPMGLTTTVTKGSYAISSTVIVLCIANFSLSACTYMGLFCTLLGLLISTLPGFIHSHSNLDLNVFLGYTLACLGGAARSVGLSIFQSFTHKAKFNGALVLFGVVGCLICGPALLFIPLVWPGRVLSWVCMLTIALLGLVIFMASNYAVTMIHPVLVCGLLQSEVVTSFIIQSVTLKDPVGVPEIIGSCVTAVSFVLLIVESIKQDASRKNNNPHDGSGEKKSLIPASM
ncbi:solute carrier family 35 member G3-like [Erpetoichthys calabaricus]|uniref:solute carrier family 35 member G3-like n=1 Tax=Erpetoichthys calabaricus TaxID=27687 RepID=UPI0022345A72|nr:solute carrier family 35 member G3-like [Erpetoichthys calabaricus]